VPNGQVQEERIARKGKYRRIRESRGEPNYLGCLQQRPLYPSFTVSSKRFYPLYLLPLQQRPLNHVLYTQISILGTFFIFIFLHTYLSYFQMYCTYFNFAKPVI
jgi:hypothetical protein